MLQRLSIVLLCSSLIFLSGCSISSVKQLFGEKLDQIVKQDQEHEQGFIVKKESLYAAFNTASHHLDLSNKKLVTIPDICALLDVQDVDNVRSLDLSDNNIRILNVDLSCLKYLKTLDLSSNNIQSIQTLGQLPALRELDMENNELTTTENFPDLPTLEKLNLAYNKLKEVKDLDHLKNLIVLELQNNVIEHIVGVERLEKLQKLKLDYDKLKAGDISPILEKLEELEIIDQLGNAIGQELKDKILDGIKDAF